MLATFLGLLVTLSFASTDYCKPVRLDGPGQSMEKMPIQDQKDFAFCYAVTAAQMIDAYRFSHGDKNTQHLTSPVALAVNLSTFDEMDYARNSEVMFQLKGDQKATYQNYLNIVHGEKAGRLVRPVESATNYFDGGDLGSTFDFNRERYSRKIKSCDQAVFDKALKDSTDFKKLVNLWRGSSSESPFADSREQVCTAESQKQADFVKAIKVASIETNLPDFMTRFTAKACENNSLKIDIPAQTKITFAEDKDAYRKLHALFDLSQPQPVGLGYCANIYYQKPNYFGHCGGHASVIIGRRRGPSGKCEFLIRNSWSEKCVSDVFKGENCEKGQYWVDDSTILNNSESMTVLLDKKAEAEMNAKFGTKKK